MKEIFLATLRTKFQGVDDAILDRIATKKAEGLTDENQIPTIIEGVSFSDVLTSYGDFRAGDATFSSIRNYEKKYNLKDGKSIEPPKLNLKHEEKPHMVKIISDAVSYGFKYKILLEISGEPI